MLDTPEEMHRGFLLIALYLFLQGLGFGELVHVNFLPFPEPNIEKSKHHLQQKRKGKVALLHYSLTVCL